MTQTVSTYEQQGIDFAKNHGVKLTIKSVDYGKYFPDDKEDRYIFTCNLQRGGKSYTFKFGQSIVKGGEEPAMYDILACLTNYDPGDFEDFCSNYGYSNDSRAAERTYKAVVKEYAAVERLFGDILEELREIQ